MSYLRKKADDTMSKYIRYRDGDVCCCCYKRGKVDAGHWIPKTNSNWGTRYDERNVHSQGVPCNRYSHPQDEYAEFMYQKYGHEVMQELSIQKYWTLVEFVNRKLMGDWGHVSTTRQAYEVVIYYYSEKLAEMKKKNLTF